MHHSVEESPKQDVGKKASNKASGEEQPPRFKAFVPPPSSLENEQQREEKWGEEIKNEAIQSCQPEDTSCCPGQSGYRGAAVVQHGSVAPHSHFTDELWSLTLGYNSCHVGSGQLSHEGATVMWEMNMFTEQILNIILYMPLYFEYFYFILSYFTTFWGKIIYLYHHIYLTATERNYLQL